MKQKSIFFLVGAFFILGGLFVIHRLGYLPNLLNFKNDSSSLSGGVVDKNEGKSISSAQQTTMSEPTNSQTKEASVNAEPPYDLSADTSGLSKSTVVMKTSKGIIKFKLYSRDAPNSSKRFAELIQSKFFNGLLFHRVVPNFVVQTGDPKSRNKNDPTIGTGGSGQKLNAEINGRKHIRGTVALAREQRDLNSADSQFYICLGTWPYLDKDYTVIGQVIDYGEKLEGKDVLDRITQWDEVLDMHLE